LLGEAAEPLLAHRNLSHQVARDQAGHSHLAQRESVSLVTHAHEHLSTGGHVEVIQPHYPHRQMPLLIVGASLDDAKEVVQIVEPNCYAAAPE
jgi:hypothetical protein